MNARKEARLQTAKRKWENALTVPAGGPPMKARITRGLARVNECLNGDIEPTEGEIVTLEGHWADIQA